MRLAATKGNVQDVIAALDAGADVDGLNSEVRHTLCRICFVKFTWVVRVNMGA